MKKISKKDLSLNKEVIASLSENEMLQVMGGKITGIVTQVESICLCKTIGENGCPTRTPGCNATRDDCSVGCTTRESDVCGPPKATIACTGNGCAFITDYGCVETGCSQGDGLFTDGDHSCNCDYITTRF